MSARGRSFCQSPPNFQQLLCYPPDAPLVHVPHTTSGFLGLPERPSRRRGSAYQQETYRRQMHLYSEQRKADAAKVVDDATKATRTATELVSTLRAKLAAFAPATATAKQVEALRAYLDGLSASAVAGLSDETRRLYDDVRGAVDAAATRLANDAADRNLEVQRQRTEEAARLRNIRRRERLADEQTESLRGRGRLESTTLASASLA